MRILFIASLLILFNFSNINAQVLKENTPTWIDKIDFETSEIDKDDIDNGSILLLYDNQINVAKKVVYNRLTTKITNNAGVQNASSINIAYDPTYQSLKLHKIKIIRDGEIIDKLDVSNFQVIRRELNAESFLYDGSLSAILNVSDVRAGDILDYSYSIYGFNPLNKKFSGSFYLNDINPIGKINITILSNNELEYKAFNTEIQPTITKKGSLHKYNWLTTNTKKLDYEESTPSWKLIYESVFISEYKSWKEVVDWGLNLYNIDNKTDKALDDKIKEIDTKYKSQGDKIKATLNFVQNDIRYLGLEFGIGGYKPFTPNTVFKRRFGDCKDKSFLMITMLKKMGIEAYPMLVNTYLKQTIKALLPSPKFFDHCVVKVIKDKSDYYYDPTISNQGGDYDSTHFPNYQYGLVIQEGNNDLDEIKPYSENKVETVEEYTLDTIGKGATLKVVTTYYESEADNMRNYFKNNSINSVKKEYENFYSNYYYNVSSLKTPHFKDELYNNIFKVYEEYKLDSIWHPMVEKENHIAVSFSPGSLLNALYVPTKDKRNSEISVIYPILREHKIKIKLPTAWRIENEKVFVNSPGFYYEWKVDYDRKEKAINLYYYLKTQKDHITKDEYKKYIQDVKKVDQTTGYYLFSPTNLSVSKFINDDSIVYTIIGFFAFFIVAAVIIVLIVALVKYSNKKTNEY
ncbi:MAG: DUF3857 domain-containing transglutaminase family protein [Algibacter sp.]